MSARPARTGHAWLTGVLLAAGGLICAPTVSQAQFFDFPDPTDGAARDLYRSALLGPRLRSRAEASYSGRLPGPNSGCPISGIGWTWPTCDRQLWGDSDAATTDRANEAVSASVGTPDYADPACSGAGIGQGVIVPGFSRCRSAGARAQTSFGESKAYAVAQFGFREERLLPNTETPEAFDDKPVRFSFESSATAESEWVTEFIPDFSDYLRLRMGVEMHEGVSLLRQPLGRGTLRYALFEKPAPALLLPPPDRCNENSFEFFDIECTAGWQLYGRSDDGGHRRSGNWGWQAVAGGVFRVNTIGVTPIPLELFMVAGRTYSLVTNFTAVADDREESNFWGTARLDYFEVPQGRSLDFDCGAGVACGFEVRTAGPSGTVVPEPSTYVLMAAGLLGLVAVRRRRTPPATASSRPSPAPTPPGT